MNICSLLNGINLIIPDECDKSTDVIPVLKSDIITEQSVLFVISSLGEENEVFDASLLPAAPYAIIADNDKKIIGARSHLIRVDNTRAAFAYAISNLYSIDYEKMKVIGVTGTNGKTSTATIIYQILLKAGYRTGFIGTGKIIIDGNEISGSSYTMTTPDPTLLYSSLRQMNDAGCEYVVMEVSSHSLRLGKVSPIHFEYGIFTNLSEEHLDFHISLEDYFESKKLLFRKVKHGLFNLDDAYCTAAYKEFVGHKSSIGIITQGDAYVTDIELNGLDGSCFYYRQKELIFKVRLRLPGAFNIYNALVALKCVIDIGVKPCIAKRALGEINNIDGRMEIIDSDIRVIIDYAHTVVAFENCVKILNSCKSLRQNLILVFGCGGDRDKGKRPKMGMIAERYADKIILTEDNCRNEKFDDIISDISAGIKSKQYIIIQDRESAIRSAVKMASPGDIVAVIGKGHEKYIVKSGSVIPFNEKEIVHSALKEKYQPCASN